MDHLLRQFLPFFLLFIFLSEGLSQSMETVVQMGHFAEINSVVSTPDCKLLLTGSKDRTVKLWNAETGTEIRTFSGHQATVTKVAISKSSNYVAATAVDGTVKIWEAATGKEVFSLKVLSKPLTDVVFFGDNYIITTGYQDSVKLVNFKSGSWKNVAFAEADLGSGNGLSIHLSEDEKKIIIGEDDRSLTVFDTKSWDKIFVYKPTDGSSCSGCGTIAAFSPDANIIAKASENTSLKIIDLSNGNVVAEIGEEEDDYTGLQFSKSGDYLLCSNDKKAIILETNSWKMLTEIEFLKGNVKSAIFNLDGSEVITGSSDNVVTIYQVESGGGVKKIFKGLVNERGSEGLKYDINSYWDSHIARYIALKNPIFFHPDGKKYLKGKPGTSVKAWDIHSGSPEVRFSGHDSEVISIAKFGKDTIASADLHGNIKIWDYNTGKELHAFKWYREPVFDLVFSSDGMKLLSSSWDGGLFIYDLKTGERSGTWLNNNSVFSACFSPDNLYLVVSKLGKSLEMIEPDSRVSVRTFYGHTDIVSKVGYLKSGKYIVSSSWDGTIRIWDPGTGLMHKKIQVSESPVYDFVIYGNDQVFIAACADGKIRWISVEDGKIAKILSGHNTEITSLALNQNGTILISQSIDGVIKFWDLQKAKEIFEHIHIGAYDWMVKTPSGYFNGTSGAMDKINFVRGLDTYSPDQFFERYYRPDILKRVINGRVGLHQELDKSPLNTSKIVVVPIEDGKRAIVAMRIYDHGGGIDEVKLLQNGKRVQLDEGGSIKNGIKGKYLEITDTLNLVSGKNIFTLSSFNASRFESNPEEVEIFSETAEKSATCYVMVIGINEYKNRSLALNYAKQDAVELAAQIENLSNNLFKNVKVHQLLDQDANRQNILDTLEMIADNVNLNDVFIFFYAGHGTITDKDFYIIPVECVRAFDENTLLKNGISADILQKKFTKIKALKQIIIFDACHSGGSVEKIAERGPSEERAILQLARSAGIHVLASAAEDQTAKEVAELKHGLFTYVLLKALSGEADGAPADGKITVYELKSFLDDQVPVINEKYSGKAQYPYTFSRGQDFPLIIVK